jgi:hypothetical protein
MFSPVLFYFIFEIIRENNGKSLARHNGHGGSIETIVLTEIYNVRVGVYFALGCKIIQLHRDVFGHVLNKEMRLCYLGAIEVKIFLTQFLTIICLNIYKIYDNI